MRDNEINKHLISTPENNIYNNLNKNSGEITLSSFKNNQPYYNNDNNELFQTNKANQPGQKLSNSKIRNSLNELNNDFIYNEYSNTANGFENSNTTLNPKQKYQEKANKEHLLEKKIKDVNLQINKLKEENVKVLKLREEYEKLTLKLQKEIKEFNIAKELEKEQFLIWKTENINAINREKADLEKQQKKILQIKLKQSSNGNNDKLKSKKNIIQSSDTTSLKVSQPEKQLKVLFKKYDSNLLYGANVSFEFQINNEYLKESTLIKEEIKENKMIKTYSCGKYEIIFQSGIKRVVYKDNHQIIYFPNGDINQIYANGKEVFLFKETETIQTKFLDGTIVFLFKNGQIEKYFPDKNKEIIANDGTVTYSSIEGYEETYSPNEDVIRITNKTDNTVVIYKKEWKMEITKLSK